MNSRDIVSYISDIDETTRYIEDEVTRQDISNREIKVTWLIKRGADLREIAKDAI